MKWQRKKKWQRWKIARKTTSVTVLPPPPNPSPRFALSAGEKPGCSANIRHDLAVLGWKTLAITERALNRYARVAEEYRAFEASVKFSSATILLFGTCFACEVVSLYSLSTLDKPEANGPARLCARPSESSTSSFLSFFVCTRTAAFSMRGMGRKFSVPLDILVESPQVDISASVRSGPRVLCGLLFIRSAMDRSSRLTGASS